MGSWYESCGFSNLPVDEKPCRFMLIRQKERRGPNQPVFYPFDIYEPASVLLPGEYTDYGGVTFSEENLERFKASLKHTGVELTPEGQDRNATVRINDEEYEVPKGIFHWFIREDVFQFLPELITRDEESTVGGWEEGVREKLKSVVIEEAKKRSILGSTDPELRSALRQISHYALRDVFIRLEGTNPKIFDFLLDEVGKSFPTVVTSEKFEDGDSFDTVFARIADPDVTSMFKAADPMMDLQRILVSMLTLRKMLHPMGGAGSQAWNDSAYEAYGNFIAGVAKKQKAYWEE